MILSNARGERIFQLIECQAIGHGASRGIFEQPVKPGLTGPLDDQTKALGLSPGSAVSGVAGGAHVAGPGRGVGAVNDCAESAARNRCTSLARAFTVRGKPDRIVGVVTRSSDARWFQQWWSWRIQRDPVHDASCSSASSGVQDGRQ